MLIVTADDPDAARRRCEPIFLAQLEALRIEQR
jgi:hypothetical protein